MILFFFTLILDLRIKQASKRLETHHFAWKCLPFSRTPSAMPDTHVGPLLGLLPHQASSFVETPVATGLGGMISIAGTHS